MIPAPKCSSTTRQCSTRPAWTASPSRPGNDYYEAAKKIRATGSYITNLAGTSNDYQPFTAQIWQAGAQPWKVDGENITINMTKDEGMQRYIQFVQKLIDEDLVDAKTPNWSDDWNRELNDGTLASLTIGAWMPINLMTGAPDQAGQLARRPAAAVGGRQGSLRRRRWLCTCRHLAVQEPGRCLQAR